MITYEYCNCYIVEDDLGLTRKLTYTSNILLFKTGRTYVVCKNRFDGNRAANICSDIEAKEYIHTYIKQEKKNRLLRLKQDNDLH